MATTTTNTEVGELPPPGRFIALSVRAGEVFANQEKALGWLQTPYPSLQESPLEAVGTEEGFEQTEEILTRIEHGVRLERGAQRLRHPPLRLRRPGAHR